MILYEHWIGYYFTKYGYMLIFNGWNDVEFSCTSFGVSRILIQHTVLHLSTTEVFVYKSWGHDTEIIGHWVETVNKINHCILYH